MTKQPWWYFPGWVVHPFLLLGGVVVLVGFLLGLLGWWLT